MATYLYIFMNPDNGETHMCATGAIAKAKRDRMFADYDPKPTIEQFEIANLSKRDLFIAFYNRKGFAKEFTQFDPPSARKPPKRDSPTKHGTKK